MDFKEKVQSMTGREIIMAMVKSLQNPSVNVDMSTFGEVKTVKSWFGLVKKRTCFGCAATNTICRIAGITLNEKNIDIVEKRALALDTNNLFLSRFENAIDMLRAGDVFEYNYYAKRAGFAEIQDLFQLPCLRNNYTQAELDRYIELANLQK